MLNPKKHRAVLLQVLKEIYSDPSLGPLLGFKGGTAAYLFYELPRFSVDLDFDLLDATKEAHVFSKMAEILPTFGKVKEKYNKRYTLFFLTSYEGGERNVKIEISKRNAEAAYETKRHLGVSMLVMKKEDMTANKLLALTNRRKMAHRDLFDVWFFLKGNWPINEAIVQKRMGISLKQYLEKCIVFVEKVNEKNMLSGMGELLDEKMKHWVRKNLKTDLLFQLKLAHENT